MKYKKLYEHLNENGYVKIDVPEVGEFVFRREDNGEYVFKEHCFFGATIRSYTFREMISSMMKRVESKYKEEYVELFCKLMERFEEEEMEYKIGEKFIWEGKELVCVEEVEKCIGCFFAHWHNCDERACEAWERKDEKAVIFKEVTRKHDVKEKQEIKIVRKLEELAGLTNGKGLYLEKDSFDEDEKIFLKFEEELLQAFDLDSTNIMDVAILKAMGFEFEWRPKLTEEEVLAKYKTVRFIEGSRNYVIVKTSDECYIKRGAFIDCLGTKYYTKEDAEAICKELNS